MRLSDLPDDPDNASALGRLAGALRLARAALWWERLWPALLPPICLAGLFLALALLDVLPLLPGWLHALVLSAFTGGSLFLLWRGLARVRPPGLEEAARRVERDSGLDHRPLAALADRLAGEGDADPLTQALWQAHRRRMARLAEGLRVAPPSPGIPARDPWGLRAAVLLLLVIALAGGWHDSGRRLARAVVPVMEAPGLAAGSVELWVTPPAYTGQAPILLKPDHGGEAVAFPAGSTVLALVTGGWGKARLRIDGNATAFQEMAEGNQRLETQILAGHHMAVVQGGRTLGEWRLAVARDAVPSIAFDQFPQQGERGRLRLSAMASDDHGIAKAWVSVTRAEAPAGEAPLAVDLPVPAGRPKAWSGASWHDLTAHPWAGLPVTLLPQAQDAAGQVGAGEAVTLTLPERAFTHPVAREVIAIRRDLTREPSGTAEAVLELDMLTADAGNLDDDRPAFLALRMARHILARHALTKQPYDLAEVQDLLWNSALRLEEGDLSSAERQLEEARQALERALDDKTSAEEITRLTEEFQAALERYLQAMAEHAVETGQMRQLQPGEAAMTEEDLGRLLEEMREMAESGSRDGLRQMLDNLSQMLAGMQAATRSQPGQGQDPGAAAKDLDELRALARRQQELLDDSYRRAQEQQPPPANGEGEDFDTPSPPAAQSRRPGNGAAQGQARQAQEALRRGLGELAGRMGQAPHSLDGASQAMGRAAQGLGKGAWDEAAQDQAEALQMLQDGAREALERMAGQQGQRGGPMGMMPRDPFGRALGNRGYGDDGETHVPDRGEVQRSREILDELRRRAGEWSRPEDERDYLQRLLKRF